MYTIAKTHIALVLTSTSQKQRNTNEKKSGISTMVAILGMVILLIVGGRSNNLHRFWREIKLKVIDNGERKKL